MAGSAGAGDDDEDDDEENEEGEDDDEDSGDADRCVVPQRFAAFCGASLNHGLSLPSLLESATLRRLALAKAAWGCSWDGEDVCCRSRDGCRRS